MSSSKWKNPEHIVKAFEITLAKHLNVNLTTSGFAIRYSEDPSGELDVTRLLVGAAGSAEIWRHQHEIRKPQMPGLIITDWSYLLQSFPEEDAGLWFVLLRNLGIKIYVWDGTSDALRRPVSSVHYSGSRNLDQ